MSELKKSQIAAAQQLKGLGACLQANRRPEARRVWRALFFSFLAALVVLNIVAISNLHPHFGIDEMPGFWPVFGLVVGVVMVFFVKKIVQPLIKRPEDYYGDL